MYNPVKLLEAVADVSNLLEAKRLLFESGLLTEAELKDLAGLDKSLDYLDKEVDKALKYSQNLEKIFTAIEPKEIAVIEYKKLFPKIKSDINKAKTDVVKKLKELPKALKSIAQRDFSSSITKRIPIGSDIADAGRAIGDFFGKDSTEGYMLSQVESIAQELTELNSLLKAIISTIARALKYSKGSDDILKIDDVSLFDIFLSGRTTGEEGYQQKGRKLVKGIGKELKKRAKMGLKQDLSIALRNLNPFAKTDDLFGLERSDIISLWFAMSPAQFMKLGPALLKPLNKGTVEIGKAAAAVQKDEEEVREETGAPSSSTSSETKVDDVVEDLSDASELASNSLTPETIEKSSDAIEEVSKTFKDRKDALMNLLRYKDIKTTYEKAINIIASNHEADEKGLYWPSYVIKMAAKYEGGPDRFYKDFDKGKFGENLPTLFQNYSSQFTNLTKQVIRAQNPGEENLKGLEKQIKEAIEAVNRTAGELKEKWDSRNESKEGEVDYDSEEALAKLQAATDRAKEEREKDSIEITPQYIEEHPQNEFDKYIKNLKATKDAKKYFVEAFLKETLESELDNFWIYAKQITTKQMDTLNKDSKFQKLFNTYQDEHLASQKLTKQILDADLSEITNEEEMVKAIGLSKEDLDAQKEKYKKAALALKMHVDPVLYPELESVQDNVEEPMVSSNEAEEIEKNIEELTDDQIIAKKIQAAIEDDDPIAQQIASLAGGDYKEGLGELFPHDTDPPPDNIPGNLLDDLQPYTDAKKKLRGLMDQVLNEKEVDEKDLRQALDEYEKSFERIEVLIDRAKKSKSKTGDAETEAPGDLSPAEVKNVQNITKPSDDDSKDVEEVKEEIQSFLAGEVTEEEAKEIARKKSEAIATLSDNPPKIEDFSTWQENNPDGGSILDFSNDREDFNIEDMGIEPKTADGIPADIIGDIDKAIAKEEKQFNKALEVTYPDGVPELEKDGKTFRDFLETSEVRNFILNTSNVGAARNLGGGQPFKAGLELFYDYMKEDVPNFKVESKYSDEQYFGHMLKLYFKDNPDEKDFTKHQSFIDKGNFKTKYWMGKFAPKLDFVLYTDKEMYAIDANIGMLFVKIKEAVKICRQILSDPEEWKKASTKDRRFGDIALGYFKSFDALYKYLFVELVGEVAKWWDRKTNGGEKPLKESRKYSLSDRLLLERVFDRKRPVRREKKKDILLERWQKLAGLE